MFAFAAAAALAGQTLILVEGQCRRLETALRDDFRVVLFLRGPLEDPKRLVLEERLRAQPEAAAVRYVAPEEGLAALRREDPELVDSVALVGENPLPGAFEVRPAPDALRAWPRGSIRPKGSRIGPTCAGSPRSCRPSCARSCTATGCA